MSKKKLNIGMIGYGFMGRTHSNAFSQGRPFLRSALPARAEGRLRPRRGQGSRPSPNNGATNRSRPIGASWSSARISISSTSPAPTTRTWRSPSRRPPGRQDDPVREAAWAQSRPKSLKMVDAVEKAKVPNMVWYNYRRVPAVTLAKQLIDEGKLGKIFHYRAKFLQDWTISADLPQGGAGPVAARRGRGRQRRHRRSARPLHRHGPLAQRRHRQGLAA